MWNVQIILPGVDCKVATMGIIEGEGLLAARM